MTTLRSAFIDPARVYASQRNYTYSHALIKYAMLYVSLLHRLCFNYYSIVTYCFVLMVRRVIQLYHLVTNHSQQGTYVRSVLRAVGQWYDHEVLMSFMRPCWLVTISNRSYMKTICVIHKTITAGFLWSPGLLRRCALFIYCIVLMVRWVYSR